MTDTYIHPVNLTKDTTTSCFLENTNILTDKGYVKIQELRKGHLIKTLKNEYVPLHLIGFRKMYNISTNRRIKDQLYRCTKNDYPELLEDLIITGCHSILVDDFKNDEKQKTIDLVGNTFITDDKYRLPACIDYRTEIYNEKGNHKIYHIALDNDNHYRNYGIYANGLLVESCSIRYLSEYSNMTLIE
jgi:hypothetical protein